MKRAIGFLTAAVLTVGLAASSVEATQYRTSADDARFVTMWYQKYLGRDPEYTGLQGWLQVLRRGGDAEGGILGSDEYYIRHGSTPESFVVGLYVEVLSRQPAFEEVQGWLVRLQQIGGDRTAMACEFLQAAARELALRGGALATAPAYAPSYAPVYQAPLQPRQSYYYPAPLKHWPFR